jgi:hypothetical protein
MGCGGPGSARACPAAAGLRLRAGGLRAAKSRGLSGVMQLLCVCPAVRRPRLGGLFHVSRGGACIAIRGWRDAGLVAAGAAASRRPLGPAPSDAGCGSVLELFAHAIELRRVLRAEPTTLQGRLLTMTSTTTTHRPPIVSRTSERTFRGRLFAPPVRGLTAFRGRLFAPPVTGLTAFRGRLFAPPVTGLTAFRGRLFAPPLTGLSALGRRF